MSEIDDDDDDGAATTTPITTGMSPWTSAGDGELADPGEREDLLDDDRAAEQADELHGEDRERRAAGVAQHVLVDDARFVEMPRLRRVRT